LISLRKFDGSGHIDAFRSIVGEADKGHPICIRISFSTPENEPSVSARGAVDTQESMGEEEFWRSLKNSWIYLHRLDNFTALTRLIGFNVTAHNEVMPHPAFQGETPDEMYFGTGWLVAFELGIARQKAREGRMKVNRAAACSVCSGETDSRALLSQRPRSRTS
jgi:hypothetical protein